MGVPHKDADSVTMPTPHPRQVRFFTTFYFNVSIFFNKVCSKYLNKYIFLRFNLFINNKFTKAATGETFPVTDPRNFEILFFKKMFVKTK